MPWDRAHPESWPRLSWWPNFSHEWRVTELEPWCCTRTRWYKWYTDLVWSSWWKGEAYVELEPLRWQCKLFTSYGSPPGYIKKIKIDLNKYKSEPPRLLPPCPTEFYYSIKLRMNTKLNMFLLTEFSITQFLFTWNSEAHFILPLHYTMSVVSLLTVVKAIPP